MKPCFRLFIVSFFYKITQGKAILREFELPILLSHHDINEHIILFVQCVAPLYYAPPCLRKGVLCVSVLYSTQDGLLLVSTAT